MTVKKISHEGSIHLADTEIKCYVLEDGTRVLSGRGMQEALNMVDSTDDGRQVAGQRLQRHLSQTSLNSFLYKDKNEDHYEPLICYKGDAKIHGYEATILNDICDAFLEARKHIQLSSRQSIIAEQCEILVRGFARVGITALVDEATGYQDVREKAALQTILDRFLKDEANKWSKTFPDEFWVKLIRVKGYPNYMALKRPAFVGHWVNDIIYDRLAPGISEKLKEVNPRNDKGHRKSKHHQHLTESHGVPELREHLSKVMVLMDASSSSDEFDKLLNRSLPKYGSTLELELK